MIHVRRLPVETWQQARRGLWVIARRYQWQDMLTASECVSQAMLELYSREYDIHESGIVVNVAKLRLSDDPRGDCEHIHWRELRHAMYRSIRRLTVGGLSRKAIVSIPEPDRIRDKTIDAGFVRQSFRRQSDGTLRMKGLLSVGHTSIGGIPVFVAGSELENVRAMERAELVKHIVRTLYAINGLGEVSDKQMPRALLVISLCWPQTFNDLEAIAEVDLL